MSSKKVPPPAPETQVAKKLEPPEQVVSHHAVLMWDKKNPRSLINLVPARVREHFEQWVFEKEQFFEMDERELYKTLVHDNKTPSPTDNRLRMKFWMEYEYSEAWQTKGIDIARVIAGICSYEFFYKKYLTSWSKVAWLLCPPAGYMVKAEEALEFGLDQLRDILEMSHSLPGGRVDTKLGELKLKIVALLEPRVKGAVPQKLMALVAGIQGAPAAMAVSQAAMPQTQEQMYRRIKLLREENEKLQNGGRVVRDVTADQKK